PSRGCRPADPPRSPTACRRPRRRPRPRRPACAGRCAAPRSPRRRARRPARSRSRPASVIAKLYALLDLPYPRRPEAMLSRKRFPLMWRTTWFTFVLAIAIAIPALGGSARADENLLRGPHPFRRDNQVSAHVLIASGRDDTMSGTKLGLDYNYKLTSGW